jgi:hypothetical protein
MRPTQFGFSRHAARVKDWGHGLARLVSLAALAIVLAVAGLVTFATGAFAHDNSVHASTPVCSTSSSYPGDVQITWTIANDYGLSETGNVTSVTGGLSSLHPSSSYSVGANGSVQLTQYLPTSYVGQTITMDISSTWSDTYSRTDTGSIMIPSTLNCKATPSLTTTANPMSGKIGSSLNDTAHLTGGASPTGTITFYLFTPSQTCSATPSASAFHQVVTVDGDADYSTTGGFASNVVGTWHWLAVYSGDTNNNGANSGCTTEPVVVSQQSPALTTTAAPSSVIIGGSSLNDTAHLTGGASPTGTITFYLFDPSQTCSATPSASAFHQVVTVDGDADYSTTGGFASNVVGTWHWLAVYSGDTDNAGTDSGCTTEPVTVTAADPQFGTQQSGSTSGPGSITLGGTVTDKATVSGNSVAGKPSGSVSFTVCATGSSPAVCPNGSAVGSAVALSASGDVGTATSATYKPTATGTYCFAAVFTPAADSLYAVANDNMSGTVQTDECFVVTAVPVVTKPTATAPAAAAPTAAPTVTTTTTTTTTTTAPKTSPAIAFTGAPIWQELLIALGAIMLGTALLVLARRRRGPAQAGAGD